MKRGLNLTRRALAAKTNVSSVPWTRLLSAFLLLASAASASGVLDLSAHPRGLDVPGREMSIRDADVPTDPSAWRSIPDSGFRTLGDAGTWSGFRPGHVLLRLPVRSPEDAVWWIRADYVDIDSFRAQAAGAASCWIGEDVPRDRWCAPWHALWIPVHLRQGLDTIHLEIAEWTGRLGISIQMEPDRIRHGSAENHALLDGLLVGLLFANLLLACYLFLFIRHKAHFWYLVYQTVVIVFVFSNHQHSFAWFWPGHPDLNQITPSFGSIGAFGALVLFLSHLLDFHRLYPLIGRFYRAMGFVLMGLCVLQLLIPVAPWVVDALYAGPQMEVFEILSYLLGVFLTLRLAFSGNRLAAFAAVASLPMLMALGMSVGGELFHEPWMYSWRGIVVEFAMCVENILFSILLAYKIGAERAEHQRLLERLLELEKGFNDRLVKETDQHLRGTALDLHDGVGQDLSALRIQADILGESMTGSILCQRFKSELARVAESLRSTAHGLYPPELKGGDLNAALALMGERMRSNEVLDLVVEGRVNGLSEDDALQWYRIAQEAVQNAHKHGQAKVVRIRVVRNRMEIEDDGRGFDQAPQDGVGLRTIRIRAAQLGCRVVVESPEAGGCRVVVAPSSE